MPERCVVAHRIVLVLALLAAHAAGARTGSGVILVLGDSLSSAYGFDVELGWVQRLQDRLDALADGYRVINASVSGDTTSGGATRLPKALALHRPEIVVVELGGNDGLRGLPLSVTRDNLERIIRLSIESGARVLLLGMRLPPNYGPEYTRQFHALYAELADQYGAARVPFLLEGVGGNSELMQDDGIHPRAEAQPLLLENVWSELEPML